MCFLRLIGIKYNADRRTQPHLRAICGVQAHEYTYSRVEMPIGMHYPRKKATKPKYKVVHVVKPITDDKIVQLLNKYDEHAFVDLPYHLRESIKARNIRFTNRNANELERWVAEDDALEHRVTNNELNFNDYRNKYLKGKNYSQVYT
jgi:hypothetical protein